MAMENNLFSVYYEKQKYKKRIMANNNYINWLCDFSLRHNSFTDDEWEYNTEDIPKIDKENVKYLGLLFYCIDEYAYENYINSVSSSYGVFYRIVYEGNAFEIGFKSGQGTYFFCNRVEYDNILEFVDFNDILTGKKVENVNRKNNLIKVFSEVVRNVYRNGVPADKICDVVKSVLDEIKGQENNKVQKK